MTPTVQSAWSDHRDPAAVVTHLGDALAPVEPRLIVVFYPPDRDGASITGDLNGRFPDAQVIGCSSAGAYTETATVPHGVVAMALGAAVVRRVVSGLADLSAGVTTGIRTACDGLSVALGADLRSLDPTRHVGLVLVDGLHHVAEDVNHVLGTVAPALVFLGGSAGDELKFRSTEVSCAGRSSAFGAVLAVVELAVPFTTMKTCSVEPTGPTVVVTRADAARRIVYELDGQPVLERYAGLLGIPTEALGFPAFVGAPFGLMLGDEPWVRSPKQVLPDGGLEFACSVAEGMTLSLLRTTDLVTETRHALETAEVRLGRPISGALLFDCVYRRLELDARSLHEPYRRLFTGFPTAAIHTYGESYLGSMNQTCIGLLW